MKTYKNFFKNLEKREAEPMIVLLKEASELIENLFILSHKDYVGNKAIKRAYKQNLKNGGTISYTDKTQKKIEQIIQEFKYAFIK